jgi:hypothetical protein
MDKRELELKEKLERKKMREEKIKLNKIRKIKLEQKQKENKSLPPNQNIINFNLIIQNNVDNIEAQKHLQTIASAFNPNFTNELMEKQVKMRKKSYKKPSSKEPKEQQKIKKPDECSEVTISTNSNKIVMQKVSSNSKSKSKPKTKKYKKNPRDENILRYLIGNRNPNIEPRSPKSNEDTQNKNEIIEPISPKTFIRQIERSIIKDIEQNFLDSVHDKPLKDSFPGKFFKSPIGDINVKAPPKVDPDIERVNSAFANEKFYSAVYQNKYSYIKPEAEKLPRPTRFPVEDKIIYDDANYYNLSSYHLNVKNLPY